MPSEWHVAQITEGPVESWVIVARSLSVAVPREAAADAVAGASRRLPISIFRVTIR